MSQDEPDVKPSEQRGGATPGDHEAREKGQRAATASDAPATDTGVDPSGGEHADAVTDGGAATPPAGGEPDLKDAAAGPRESDRASASD